MKPLSEGLFFCPGIPPRLEPIHRLPDVLLVSDVAAINASLNSHRFGGWFMGVMADCGRSICIRSFDDFYYTRYAFAKTSP